MLSRRDEFSNSLPFDPIVLLSLPYVDSCLGRPIMTKSSSVEAHQYLSIDSLIQGLRERFEAIPDPRRAVSTDHTLAYCLMAALAMFSL